MIRRIRKLKRRLTNRRYHRFAILSAGRTGSTMLHTCLQRHTRVLSSSEVFNIELFEGDPERIESIRKDPIEYLRKYVFVDYSPITRAVGFKMLYSQCPEPNCSRFLQWMLDSGIRVIHLKRRDSLAMYVSGLVARQENRWHVLEEEENVGRIAPLSIYISQEKYLGFITELTAQVQSYDRLLRDVSHLEIFYEDLIENMGGELRRVTEFLGVRFEDGMKPMTKKRITQPLSEIVLNYAELVSLSELSR